MRGWVREHAFEKFDRIKAIGTGGNINKLFELGTKEEDTRKMTLDSLIETQSYLKSLSLEERLNKLQLNPDRADVIIPASDIYIEVMKSAGAKKIFVPDTGLKDGINLHMYKKKRSTSEKVFVRN